MHHLHLQPLDQQVGIILAHRLQRPAYPLDGFDVALLEHRLQEFEELLCLRYLLSGCVGALGPDLFWQHYDRFGCLVDIPF